MNKLYYGDNLDILKQLYSEHPKGFIDLIYIDPPFNSNRNYNILFEDLINNESEEKKNKALKEAFVDTWSNVNLSRELEELKSYSDNPNIYNFLHANQNIFSSSQISYLTMMAHRIYYMQKLLKETGSFYLHCDPTASHYLKILLDIIFGSKNFRNEIVWSYKRWTAVSNRFQKLHDTVFFYIKGQNADVMFNTPYVPYGDWIKKDYSHFDDKLKKRYRWHTVKGKKYKVFLEDENKGVKMGDVWDIPIIGSTSKERLGYPTQKPEALLERIIKASSNEGSLVADFFCGCGTTITVAQKLNRSWLGVDINHLAISLIEEKRLKPLKAKYEVIGFPKDMASAEKLAANNKYKFEYWIVEYVFQGHKTKASGDGGIDGHVTYNMGNKKVRAVIEVKGGSVTINQIRAFKDNITKFNADFGIFVGFGKKFTKGMYQEADQLGFIETIDSLLHYDKVKKMYLIPVEDILEKNLPLELQYLSKNITY